MLVDDDARARVAPKMLKLDVTGVDDDVEAAVAPLMPDRGEQHAAVLAIGGEDGNERLLEQVGEIPGPELVHAAESTPV